MKDLILRLWIWKEKNAQTLVEYALLAALIVIAIILVLAALGGRLGELFQNITDKLGQEPVKK